MALHVRLPATFCLDQRSGKTSLFGVLDANKLNNVPLFSYWGSIGCTPSFETHMYISKVGRYFQIMLIDVRAPSRMSPKRHKVQFAIASHHFWAIPKIHWGGWRG